MHPRPPGYSSAVRDTQSFLFDALGANEREALTAHLRPRHYRRGHVVFNDGDRGDCLYIVQRGRLDVQVTTLLGQTITLRVVQPGELFGELALVHPDNHRVGRVSALEETDVWALYRHDFEGLRQLHPGVDRFLVTALAERVVRTSEIAAEMLLPPENRLWRRLWVLAQAYGDEPIKMSQDDLARMAGTVRQTANRALQSGVRQGVLIVERGSITVIDRPALERLARQ
jgi:CRP/FNR family transcriptional regulator, cyclic AMP receptor protein